VPISIALLYRKVIPIFLSLLVVVVLVGILNLNPTILNELPYAVQRSASVLLLDKGVADSYGLTAGSDIWHEDLRKVGFTKWTKDWNSFFFGTGIRPFDTAIQNRVEGTTTTFADVVDASSKVGAYESGWWTVIAVTGLVGLISYLLVFGFLLRRLVPILWREKVIDHSHAFAFLSVFGIANWLFLGWANGGFPGVEIMYGFIALCALEDHLRKTKAPRAFPPRPIPRLHRPARMMQPAERQADR
jgi:hypothetical protein